MSTAKSRAYEVFPVSVHQDNEENADRNPYCRSCDKKTELVVKDHEFDRRAQKKERLGKLSKSSQAPKGLQSVRFHYAVDESKILPSLLDAIQDEELESMN